MLLSDNKNIETLVNNVSLICFDVFVQNLDSDIFYVFFDYRNPNLDVMLSNIFALKFDNNRLTSLKKYIKDCYTQHILVRESEYKYQNDKLVSAEIYDDFQHYEFSFFTEMTGCSTLIY